MVKIFGDGLDGASLAPENVHIGRDDRIVRPGGNDNVTRASTELLPAAHVRADHIGPTGVAGFADEYLDDAWTGPVVYVLPTN